MSFEWTSYGANLEVTGSCHMIETKGGRILIDCGLFQGRGGMERNQPPFPFDPAGIDVVVVTHAHLDHIGRLPLLVKEGFRGTILSTRATYELARLSLFDSASVMLSDVRRKNRRLAEQGREERVEPLYDEDDIFEALDCWDSHLKFGESRELLRGVKMTAQNAGHILGSASLLLEIKGDSGKTRIAHSGDLGNYQKPLVPDPDRGPRADLAVVEATYGDRDHRSFEESVAEMEEVIKATVERGGNVIIPTFALERSQELLYVLHRAWKEGRIPEWVQIFLDSPMAINATGIYQRHRELFNEEALEAFGNSEDPFSFRALTYTRSGQESRGINSIRSGAVILAGSGMVTGGRVLDHLRHNLGNPACSVVFMGFQAEGTKGRQLVEGAESIWIHGREIFRRAEIHTIGGFSAHAGHSELVKWVEETGAKEAILVHGEVEAMEGLEEALKAKGVRRRGAGEPPEAGA